MAKSDFDGLTPHQTEMLRLFKAGYVYDPDEKAWKTPGGKPPRKTLRKPSDACLRVLNERGLIDFTGAGWALVKSDAKPSRRVTHKRRVKRAA